ncbi:hypothetical protein R3P38DRAFT_2770957 [Favolaschia claudopus]|uniref:Uncharacterized protein n=1 Tax=Favolaschia claudopus TaxID=2862362 RepID=A0AAW0CGG9_9AGAR
MPQRIHNSVIHTAGIYLTATAIWRQLENPRPQSTQHCRDLSHSYSQGILVKIVPIRGSRVRSTFWGIAQSSPGKLTTLYYHHKYPIPMHPVSPESRRRILDPVAGSIPQITLLEDLNITVVLPPHHSILKINSKSKLAIPDSGFDGANRISGPNRSRTPYKLYMSIMYNLAEAEKRRGGNKPQSERDEQTEEVAQRRCRIELKDCGKPQTKFGPSLTGWSKITALRTSLRREGN